MPEIIFSEKIFPEDLSEIHALLSQLTGEPNQAEFSLLSEVMEKGHIFAARDSGKLIGMATLTIITKPTARFGTVEDVIVDKKYRGQGLGRKLMDKLMEKVAELGLDYIELTSRPSRIEANNLYRKMGFELRETNVYRYHPKLD